MEKEGKPLIISENDKFQIYKYKSEKELEDIVVKYVKKLFGEEAIYFNKKKITSSKGISGITDGFIIDFKNKKFYVVEVELSVHDIISHIYNQIGRFKIALGNRATLEQLANTFLKDIKERNIKYNDSLEDILQIINNKFEIVIIIDEVSEQLTEVVNCLSKDGTKVIAIPFETYINSENNSLHRFTTFTKEALEEESKKWTFKWSMVPVEKHLNNAETNLKNVFLTLSKQICSLPNVKEKSRKGWVTYQTSPLKNFCTIKVFQDQLEVHIKCDDSFKDEKEITKKIKRTPAWTFDRTFTVKSFDDLKGAIYFIKQAYDCICCNNVNKHHHK